MGFARGHFKHQSRGEGDTMTTAAAQKDKHSNHRTDKTAKAEKALMKTDTTNSRVFLIQKLYTDC